MPLLGARRALSLFFCTLTVACVPGCLSGTEPASVTPDDDEQRNAGEEGAAEESATGDEAAAERGGADDVIAAEPFVPPSRVEDGFFMADGAPPPQACAANADCVGNTVPAATGCCQAPHPIRPHSRAYARWVSEWRARSCGGVECPPPPPPSRPPACHAQLRCEAGQCRDACPSPP